MLSGEESRHLMTVMRARVGDEVILFDGSGSEFPARISQLSKNSVSLAVLSEQAVDRELSVELVLAASLPRGDRQRWLVEKAVELGVARLVPLVTQRGVAQPTREALDRLRRAVIEASKQCGRNRLLRVGDPRTVAQLVAEESGADLRLWAHPGSGRAFFDAVRGQTDAPTAVLAAGATGRRTIVFAVGPEGGFADEEAELARRSGWQLVELGARILRIETAAIAMVASIALSIESGHA